MRYRRLSGALGCASRTGDSGSSSAGAGERLDDGRCRAAGHMPRKALAEFHASLFGTWLAVPNRRI